MKVLLLLLEIATFLIEEYKKGETKQFERFKAYLEKQKQRDEYERKTIESIRHRVTIDDNAGILLKP